MTAQPDSGSKKKNHNKTIFESHSSNEMPLSTAMIVTMFDRENQRGSYNKIGCQIEKEFIA